MIYAGVKKDNDEEFEERARKPESESRRFTTEDKEFMKEYFQITVTSKRPTLSECTSFLLGKGRKFFSKRTDKHIQSQVNRIRNKLRFN